MNSETPVCQLQPKGLHHGALSLIRRILPDQLVFLDVGAYIGDFSAALLEAFPRARGVLFEPTEQSRETLARRFAANPAIRIFDLALSDESGTKDFFTTDTPAANSLLELQPAQLTRVRVSKRIETLDRFLEHEELSTGINLLKVDTQGNDLKVLLGAKKTLGIYRPAILIESIFVELYAGQGSYFEIFDFMKEHDYRLGGIFESHATQEGLIAFADLLFLPSGLYTAIAPQPGHEYEYHCTDASYLVSQNKLLQTACEERLELIHRLHATAEERLKAIEVLDAEVKRLSGRKKN